MRPSAPSLALKSLPELIASSASSLPSSSRIPLRHPLFIRPASFPPNSYYAITRTKLKFTPAAEVARRSTAMKAGRVVATSGSASGSGSGLAGGEGTGEADVGADGVGEVRVSGKAWGRLYWGGKAVQATTRAGNPLPKSDTLIHGGSKRKWVMADPSLITASVLDELEAARRAARDAITAAQ